MVFFVCNKVMTMSRQAFEEHREKEGWSDAEDESKDDTAVSLSFGNLCIRNIH